MNKSRRNRQQQHRPTNDAKTVKGTELRDLKSENRKLRTENARLRRRIDKRLQAFDQMVSDLPTTLASVEEESDGRAQPAQLEQNCPECKSTEIIILSLPRDYLVCKACKWRKAI